MYMCNVLRKQMCVHIKNKLKSHLGKVQTAQ